MVQTKNSRGYHYEEQAMYLMVTFTRHAARVEKWIFRVKDILLDNSPVKCVGLDYEYTTSLKNVKQKYLPAEEQQRAPILQLSATYENLVFQISKADGVLDPISEFLRAKEINLCGAAINNDVRMLQWYGIEVVNTRDLQAVIGNPMTNLIGS